MGKLPKTFEPGPPAAFSLASTISASSILNYNSIVGQTFRVATTVSLRGIQFIEAEEGLKKIPYDDLGSNPPRGNCTIGYGHLIHFGICTQADFSQYPSGITQNAAEQLLYGDVFSIALYPIKFLVSVPLAQKELDALVDFTFNIGSGNSVASLQKQKGLASTTLLRVLNLGLYSAVPAEFKKFVNSGGLPVQALVRRRNDEAYLWTTGIYFANGRLIP